MQLHCTICKEIYIAHSEVYVTCCGHLYHEACISQWTSQKQTCPQCRTRLKTKPFRIYFNIDEVSDSDPSSLMHKLDQATYNNDRLMKENKKMQEDIEGYKSVASALREEVRNVESDLAKAKSYVQAMKREIHTMKALEQTHKLTSQELADCKRKLSTYEGLDTVLKGTVESVRSMVATMPITIPSFHQIATYLEVLKEKNKKVQKTVQRLNEDIKNAHINERKLTAEIKRLTEDLEIAEARAESMVKVTSPAPHCSWKSPTNKADLIDLDEDYSVVKLPQDQSKASSHLSTSPHSLRSPLAPLAANTDFDSKRKLKISPVTFAHHFHKRASSHQLNFSKNIVFDGMGGSTARSNLSRPMNAEERAEMFRKRAELKKSQPCTKKRKI